MSLTCEPFSMADQRVLIVGASSGIGRATAQLISALGGHPILASRSSDRLEAVRGDLADPKGAVLPVDGGLLLT
ncbi:MAG: SDR family NAD(P)-dependent oxidoreductase [Holophagales bacterium]|nr:SDR family NAD(P)-dependent oxidoreductase [Holophagales bacterium]